MVMTKATEKKKAIIIGSSIAGLALAYLLSKKMQVKVFEQKPKGKIGEKVCANVVTSSFLELARKLDINPKQVIVRKFSHARFYSEKNSFEIPIQDYEIDRKKLVGALTKKALERGAEFCFKTKFLDLEKTSAGYNVLLEKNQSKIIESADFVIGADGALSNVAKKAGLWRDRQFWLAIQTRVSKIKRKISKQTYEIFFIKKLGYYSYIFPSQQYVVGVVASPENAKEKFDCFLKFLGIKNYKIESALIPQPRVIKIRNGNIFLLGDAACQVKFTAGGIVPAIGSAFALRDLIVHRSNKRFRALKKEISLHHLIAKVLSRLSDAELNNLFGIAKKSNISLVKSRDELRKWAVGFVLKNPILFKFLPKLF